MSPTPDQLARAAELAPKVAEAIGWSCYEHLRHGYFIRPDEPYNREEFYLLDALTFQAVVLALPLDLYHAALEILDPNESLAHPRNALTTEWMLAFYEALVKAQEEDGKTE